MSRPVEHVKWREFESPTDAKLRRVAHDIDLATDAYRDAVACSGGPSTEYYKTATTNYILTIGRLIGDQFTVRELLQLAKLIGADSYI